MKITTNNTSWRIDFLLVLAGRSMLMFGLPYVGWLGYGDLLHYHTQASMGWPMIDYWVEYPPLFPYLSRLLYMLTGGREHIFVYLLGILLTISQAGSVVVFRRIYSLLPGNEENNLVPKIYMILSIVLPYGWWYMDALVVFAMLMGIYLILRRHDIAAAIWIALGVLTKVFPILILPVYWKFNRVKESVFFIIYY